MALSAQGTALRGATLRRRAPPPAARRAARAQQPPQHGPPPGSRRLPPAALPARASAAAAAAAASAPPAVSHAAAAAAAGLDAARLPRHVAIVMDGNTRWATARGLPAAEGHRRGSASLTTAVQCCTRWGIPALTVFAFSTDNWRRPPAEVAALFEVMQSALAEELPALLRAGVRLRIAGDTAALPPALSAALAAAAAATAGGTALNLTVAVNYSGRSDIVAAARRLAAAAAAGSLRPEAIDDAAFAQALCGDEGGVAEPDVIIRTSGEQRLSNFMLWQAAFAELVFCDVLWPDFEERHLAAALAQFAARQRRFGGRAG